DVVLEIVMRADSSVGPAKTLQALCAGLAQRPIDALPHVRVTPQRRIRTPAVALDEVTAPPKPPMRGGPSAHDRALGRTKRADVRAIVLRVLRDERRRSDARVAALAAVARTDGSADAADLQDELLLHDAPVAAGPMFVEPVRESPWGNRLAVMSAIALLATTV